MYSCNVQVKARRNESAESLIKRFNRKVKNAGIVKEVLNRRYYIKPSVKKRKEKMKREKVLEKLKREQNKR
jgi:small subunit ribosomal protein S21|tara:strand:+ start:66 stop:278 length:213 start_codon:yes stop_codon:yes gene_type:complete